MLALGDNYIDCRCFVMTFMALKENLVMILVKFQSLSGGVLQQVSPY